MNAILCLKYGSPDIVLQLKEVEKPVPKENEALVKIYAAAANPLDLQMRGGMARLWSGLRRPRDPRLGTDIAGRVEAVGGKVTKFQPGDEIFGTCRGGFAEYACANENALAMKPARRSFEEAAAVPVAGITALQGLRDAGQIQAGQKVLIDGASGGVGTFAVQIAKAFGAEVTGVCSPANIDRALQIGADQVIDYTKEDFTQSGLSYDLILGVNGYHPISAYQRSLKSKGIYVMAGASKAHIFKALLQVVLLGPLLSKNGGQKIGFMGIAKINSQDLSYLRDLMEAGKIIPVIDRLYGLSQTGDALKYLEEGHARGKVVVRVEHPE